MCQKRHKNEITQFGMSFFNHLDFADIGMKQEENSH